MYVGRHLARTLMEWGQMWLDTQEKSAVRCPLIRWKTVRFSIEDRVIALSVFASERSGIAKLRKSFNHANSTLKFPLALSFRTVIHIDG